MFGAPLLATKWFEDSKRVIVICFTYMIAFLASDHSFGVNRWVLDNVGDNDEKALFVLFSIKASLSLLICIITLLTLDLSLGYLLLKRLQFIEIMIF